MDREGSKSQLRHTEPPQNKTRGENVSSESFVQQLLNDTFQQEQQQSGVLFFSERQRGRGRRPGCPKKQNTETGYAL